MVAASAEPVFPTSPTLIGTDDPYNSVSPVIRARVAVVAEEVTEPDEENAQPVDGNGIPVARPVMEDNTEEPIPAQRVRLPPPRAIEFE